MHNRKNDRKIVSRIPSPIRPAEIKRLRREIIDEIEQHKAVSSRGLSRERAVKRKMKSWHIKKDFSTRQSTIKPVIRIK